MADVPKNVEEIAKRMWDMAQRVAVQIAEKPSDLRDAAFAVVGRNVREMAKEMKVPADKIDAFVELQMQAMRKHVTDIDVGGSPQGGKA
jgi:tRNA G26 N,N-dimethylase Trm1